MWPIDLEALSVQQEMTVTEQNESYSPTTSITFEAKEKVRQGPRAIQDEITERSWQKHCAQHWACVVDFQLN